MREFPRVPVEKLAKEIVRRAERSEARQLQAGCAREDALVEDKARLGLVVDLSPTGLCLERSFFGRRQGRLVQLEFVMPEVNEIVWAKGEVCFDRLRPDLIRSTGIRLVSAASRHMRMLRDFVMSAVEASDAANPVMCASHWRG